jgi:hypothetical protein
MRRLRVTASMQKQLADVRAMKHSARRGGVMRVPAILSCDAWEAIASVQQDKLIADSYEDRVDRSERLVMNVESKDEAAFRVHRESEVLYQQARREQPQAIRDYLNAQVPKA